MCKRQAHEATLGGLSWWNSRIRHDGKESQNADILSRDEDQYVSSKAMPTPEQWRRHLIEEVMFSLP